MNNLIFHKDHEFSQIGDFHHSKAILNPFAKFHVSIFTGELGVESDFFMFFVCNQIGIPARYIPLWPTPVKSVQTIYDVCL